MKNSLYVPKNTSRSSLESIIVNVINENGGGGSVSLAGNNTWTGIQTFSATPVISTIKNTGILTLPTSTGTVALTSQLPTNSSYVDLTTNQTVGGIKTFSSSPVISSITNTGILTLPATTGTLALTSQIPTNSSYVDLTTNQTVGGIKTFSNNTLSSTASTGTASCNYGLINSSNGMRSDAANTLRLVTNAVDRIVISTNSIQNSVQSRFLSGSAAIPGITFTSDTGNNSGLYLIADDQIGTSIGGTNVKTLTASADTSTIQCNMPSLGLTNGGFTSVLSGTLTGNRTLTIPDSSGQLCLTSQIPTNSSYVDLTTNQTVGGIKTFSSAPVISSISNTGTLTLPTTSGFLLESVGNYSSVASQGVTFSNAQTISNAGYLAGATINAASSTYTDSATAASGTVGQVSDFLIGARTFAATNTSVLYTSAASLQITGPPVASTNVTITTANAIQVDSGNLRLTNGRLISTALGTASLPALAVGAFSNDGIYSSAAGSLNVATAGTLRATLSASNITFAANYPIVCSGSATITSGTGGFTSAGPVSSSLASTAASCAIRPTNSANTGIFGTASTNVSVSVGGTAIVSVGPTGAAVTGTLAASGVSTLTGGAKISSTGTTFSSIQFGSVTSTSLSMAQYSNASTSITFATAFASAPNVIVTLQNVAGSVTNGDNLSYSVGGPITTTQCTIYYKNSYNTTVSGTATFSYIAWI
jgi:phosphoserine aminotransferase